MLSHFIFSFLRSLRANKMLTLINVFSLALGLAVFAIASLYVQRELSYDHEWPNAERIHRLVIQNQGVPASPDGFTTSINPSSYQALLSYFSEQIEAATRLVLEFVRVQVGEVDKGGTYLTFVDPAFADIFTLEVLEGSLTQVLENPGLIALTEARAEVLGESGRVGQRLLVKHNYAGGEQEFVVGAIVRLPELTTQFREMGMLAVFSEHAAALFVAPESVSWEVSTFIRLLLKPGEGAQEFNDQLPDFVESTLAGDYGPFETDRISEHLFYELQPIRETYLDGLNLEDTLGGDKAKVITFAVVGVLVLLVGCSNSASLSFANALLRRREVGIRKASGADKQTIMFHYLGESVLLALASSVLALALQELMLAPVQGLLNISGELSPSLTDRGLLLVIAAFIGLINGAYPAFVLSELRPQAVLKPAVGSGSKGVFRARAFLVGGQLTLTVMFLASAFVLYAQLMFVQAQPLGYDHRNLLYFSYGGSSLKLNSWVVTNKLLDIPGVVAAAPNVTAPPNMNLPLNINAFNLVSKDEYETEVQATRWMMFEGFPEMLGVPLLAGRALEETRDSWTNFDLSTTVEHALITRRAAEALGFASPEGAVDELIYMRGSDASGQPLDAPLLIVGVLEDSLYSSIHRLPVPEFYILMPETNSSTSQFVLRYEPAVAKNIQQAISALFVEPYGIEPFFMFFEDRIEGAYFQERSESRLLLIAAGMALLLSCVGMYGLVATIMARSVKEVGIRKAMGASTACLLGLFLWRFSRPALFANLIAWPLAGWFVLRWVQRFPYQIDLAWLPPLFFSASLLVLMVAWLTIAAVTARAAQWKPSKSLRYE